MQLNFRNVNDAFTGLVKMFHTKELCHGADYLRHGDEAPIVSKPSRNGPVLMIDEPVLITYTHPTERVLFNQVRDANPFFHAYESMWMLAGRNDVESVAYYAANMKQFSDDGERLNGAYGYRWRQASVDGGWASQTRDQPKLVSRDTVDQLDLLVNHLRSNPESRRAVLQMWNVEDDLLKVGSTCPRCGGPGCYFCEDEEAEVDEYGNCEQYPGAGNYNKSKDVCCNLSVMFSLRTKAETFLKLPEDPRPKGTTQKRIYLDMTVTNRSNDLLWGCLGANYVHFTVLQEYMAARLGCEVGRYHHMSNNLHVYEQRPDWKPEALLADEYEVGPMKRVPLVEDDRTFEEELPHFVNLNDGVEDSLQVQWAEPFLQMVAQPMLNAFKCHKTRDYRSALQWCEMIVDDAWRLVSTAWIDKRRVKYEQCK